MTWEALADLLDRLAIELLTGRGALGLTVDEWIREHGIPIAHLTEAAAKISTFGPHLRVTDAVNGPI